MPVQKSKSPLPTVFVQHWRAENDANGNPRRVFVISAPDRPGTGLGARYTSVKAAWDEGYNGDQIVSELVATGKLDVVLLPEVDMPPRQYNKILKQFGSTLADSKALAAYVAEHAPQWGV